MEMKMPSDDCEIHIMVGGLCVGPTATIRVGKDFIGKGVEVIIYAADGEVLSMGKTLIFPGTEKTISGDKKLPVKVEVNIL